MLVLRRKAGEKIDIGNDVTICVVKVDGTYAYVGVEAPRDVPVNRREVTERIEREGRKTTCSMCLCEFAVPGETHCHACRREIDRQRGAWSESMRRIKRRWQ